MSEALGEVLAETEQTLQTNREDALSRIDDLLAFIDDEDSRLKALDKKEMVDEKQFFEGAETRLTDLLQGTLKKQHKAFFASSLTKVDKAVTVFSQQIVPWSKDLPTLLDTQLMKSITIEGDYREDFKILIAQYFFQTGRLDLGDSFCAACGISPEKAEELRRPFTDLHVLRSSLESGDLDLVLNWCMENREALESRGSTLLFKLHRLRMVNFVRSGQAKEALAYAHKNLTAYARTHMKDIEKLVTALVWNKATLDKSPYGDLLSPKHMTDAIHSFMRDYCLLKGTSQQSPLEVCLLVGNLSLPPLLKLAGKLTAVQNAPESDQLPIEIELPAPYRQQFEFHSVFVCPVSRQQCTSANPPMLLPCCHVLSREAMQKLVRGSGHLKCPYCPQECSVSQCRELHF